MLTKKKKKSCKEKIIILNTCVNFDFPMGFYHFLGIYFSFFLVYLASSLFLCFVYLFVFVAHVFWVSFALLLLFPTFVAAYPFTLSCFVLCALLFSPSPKSIPLHNLGTHSHHSLLSLSLSTFVSFFLLFLQKFVSYLSFGGKILAKFCFANF